MFEMLKEPNFWWAVLTVVIVATIVFPPAGFGMTVGYIAAGGGSFGAAQVTGSSKRREKEQSRARQEQFMESLNQQPPKVGRNKPKQSPNDDNQVKNTESNSAKKDRKSAKSPNDLVNAVKKELEAEKQKQKNNAPD